MSTKKTTWDDEPAKDDYKTAEPKAEANPAPVAAGMVRVRCITDTSPHTDKKGLANGEEADVPEAVAKAMEAKGQVERV